MQLAPFDPTKKKKKKKVVIQENADESVDSLAEKTESLSGNFYCFVFSFLFCQLYYLVVNELVCKDV